MPGAIEVGPTEAMVQHFPFKNSGNLNLLHAYVCWLYICHVNDHNIHVWTPLNSKTPTNSRYSYIFSLSSYILCNTYIYIYKATLSGKTLKHFLKISLQRSSDHVGPWIPLTKCQLGNTEPDLDRFPRCHLPRCTWQTPRCCFCCFYGFGFQEKIIFGCPPPKKKNQVEVRDILIGKEFDWNDLDLHPGKKNGWKPKN